MIKSITYLDQNEQVRTTEQFVLPSIGSAWFDLPEGCTMLKPELVGIGLPRLNEQGEACYSAYAVTCRFEVQ